MASSTGKNPMKTWNYAVTFETPETRPPDTIRGTCASTSPAAALARAFRAATKQRKGQRWESLVVLLERGDAVVDTPE
jgi:hypothetical protein